MRNWTPATQEEVEQAVAAEREETDPICFEKFANMLVTPYRRTIHRFGRDEQVFVVARAPQRVVYFDDIEEDFATAREVDGQLVDSRSYGPLVLALEEAAAGA